MDIEVENKMTKKDESLSSIIVAAMIGLFAIFTIFYIILYPLDKYYEEGKAEDLTELQPVCTNRCQNFDMTYYELVKDGWLYDCWCIDPDTNKPFKVSTLESPRIQD